VWFASAPPDVKVPSVAPAANPKRVPNARSRLRSASIANGLASQAASWGLKAAVNASAKTPIVAGAGSNSPK
jgi:hypothetical protein